jgi:hypothetical protein
MAGVMVWVLQVTWKSGSSTVTAKDHIVISTAHLLLCWSGRRRTSCLLYQNHSSLWPGDTTVCCCVDGVLIVCNSSTTPTQQQQLAITHRHMQGLLIFAQSVVVCMTGLLAALSRSCLQMWGFACAYCVLFRRDQEHEVRLTSNIHWRQHST